MTDEKEKDQPIEQFLEGISYIPLKGEEFNDPKAQTVIHIKFIKEGELKLLFNVNADIKRFSNAEKYAVVKTLEQFIKFLYESPEDSMQ